MVIVRLLWFTLTSLLSRCLVGEYQFVVGVVNSAARRKAWKASDRAAQIAILSCERWPVDC